MFKPFDQDLFNKHDGAKNVVLSYLQRNGLTKTQIGTQKEIDIVDYENKIAFEVEEKIASSKNPTTESRWAKGDFPFNTVRLMPRKVGKLDKWMKTWSNGVWFIITNPTRTHFIAIDVEVVKNHGFYAPNLKTNWYNYGNGVEIFTDVPLKKCQVHSFDDNVQFWV